MLYHANTPFCVKPDNGVPFSENIVYLPLYKDYAAKIFDTSSEIDILQSYREISDANSLIDQMMQYMLRGYEISLTGTDFYSSLVTSYQKIHVPLL